MSKDIGYVNMLNPCYLSLIFYQDVKDGHKLGPSINRLISPCIIYEVAKILIHHMDVLFIYKQPNIKKKSCFELQTRISF